MANAFASAGVAITAAAPAPLNSFQAAVQNAFAMEAPVAAAAEGWEAQLQHQLAVPQDHHQILDVNLQAFGAGVIDAGVDGQAFQSAHQQAESQMLLAMLGGGATSHHGEYDMSSVYATLAAEGRQVGTMRHVQADRRFGFIKPDDGSADIFALPPPEGFPELGHRVSFIIAFDSKTVKTKADNLQLIPGAPLDISFLNNKGKGKGGGAQGHPYALVGKGPFSVDAFGGRGEGGKAPRPPQGPQTVPSDNILTGTISAVNEKFAFVRQDTGEADMFVIPPACDAFGRELPPVGTRVQYRCIMDPKSGRPRAADVAPALM